MNSLLDTGFLLAVLDEDDSLHESCAAALQEEIAPLLPNVVLPELAYLILRELGYGVLTSFLRAVTTGELVLIDATLDDLERATELLATYADSRVDFVDCVIAAMAERMKITRILTVDRRHFGLLRPAHCDYFEIIPA
ncbi:MAG: PIN domain-containing protein [Acidobacteria bacterium]|nr:PIN domain-containing protein [Acidobacteriota bacterium]